VIARRALAAVVWGLALAPASVPAAAPAEPAKPSIPNLAGRWQLNRELSEDARQKMREAMNKGQPRSGLMGGRRPRGGGSGRAAGALPPEGFGGTDPEADGTSRDLLAPPEQLTVTQTEGLVTIEDGERVLRLYTDGRKSKRENGLVEVRARWKGSELVVESKGADLPKAGSDSHQSTPKRIGAPKSVTVYGLDVTKRQLLVTTHLDVPFGESVVVRRVYDVAPEEERATTSSRSLP
jgi:hypothetical protein